MKRIISHRGNLYGPNSCKENHPDSLADPCKLGFDVEVDVWFIDNKFILGHDKPEYEIKKYDLLDNSYWIHCKNIEALFELSTSSSAKSRQIQYFYHNSDDAVLTSRNKLWTYPGKPLTSNSIAVLPELYPDQDLSECAGVCTDFPIKYKLQFT